jgi:hypothetical protein
MAKKHKKNKHRNAAPSMRSSRNAAPAPRPRANRAADDTSLQHLGYTAAGAAGTALVGSLLARRGWAPKTIASALTAVGAGLAWKGDGSTIRSIGAGTMSAAGSQLALMVIDDQEHPHGAPATKKPANADGLPPGALEGAFERARRRLALSAGGGEGAE